MVNRRTLTPELDMTASSAMWVVFSNDTDLKFLKILRYGFRHCFIVMQQDNRWILVDPRSDKTEIQILPHSHHFNFPRFFIEQGKTVLKIPSIQTPRKIASVLPISCVEMIKRIIGLHQWWVVTPHQLYRSILKLTHQKG